MQIDCQAQSQINCQTQSCLRAQIDCQKAYQNTRQIAIQSTCQNKFYVENYQHQSSHTSVSQYPPPAPSGCQSLWNCF
jgi:hypothetical protein